MSGCAFSERSSPGSALGRTGSVSGGREAAAEGPAGPPPAAPAGGAERHQQREEEPEVCGPRPGAERSRRNVRQRER
ncbi:uncharacterized protein [Pithys albifrons albifrons]|uniref:uncharacterized protein isoform X3 n=1 Tax=Pithys albifrons albifrons TaxID=3385563 RepID=UPI003A5D1D19